MDDRSTQLQELEAEISHWEQQLEPEVSAREEANMQATATLDAISPRLRRTRKALEQLKVTPPDQYDTALAELEEDVEDVRDAFKRLDEKAHPAGPTSLS